MSTALQTPVSGEGSGIYVKTGSDITSPKDLKGKTFGSFGLRSTGHTLIRIALARKYGLNVALEGGDLKQIEIQAPNLPAALSTGQVDAAALINSQAYLGTKSGAFRSIAETARDNTEMFGIRFVSAINVAYPDRLAARQHEFQEFNRMFRESVNYAKTHREEVFSAVGKKYNLDAGFFNWWFDKAQDVPAYFSEEHARAIMKYFELSKEMGLLKSYPDIRSLVWQYALRS